MKEAIDPFAYAPNILSALPKGILLTTKTAEKVNTMTIGWGTLGIEWGLPVFIVFVRLNRFTHACLEQNPEFTINASMGPYDRRIIGIAGARSGRNMDKIKEMGAHLEQPEVISVPGIAELPLTLECRVIYKQDQILERVPRDLREELYPADVDGSHPGCNRDLHTAYYGQIVASYIIR